LVRRNRLVKDLDQDHALLPKIISRVLRSRVNRQGATKPKPIDMQMRDGTRDLICVMFILDNDIQVLMVVIAVVVRMPFQGLVLVRPVSAGVRVS
jgi:hypothetical protein